MNYSRIGLGILSISFTSLLLAGSTVAFFTDQGTSSSNIFGAGTIDMKFSDDDEILQDSVTGTWGASNLKPGGSAGTFIGNLLIRNSGTADANSITLDFSNVVTESTTLPGSIDTIPMDSVISIEILQWDANGDGNPETDLKVQKQVHDFNGNGFIDLDDLEHAPLNRLITFTTPQSTDHVLYFRGLLDQSNAVNQHQGDSVTMTITATLSQETPP